MRSVLPHRVHSFAMKDDADRFTLHVPFRRAGVCTAFNLCAILAAGEPSARRLLIFWMTSCSSGIGTRIRLPFAPTSSLSAYP